MGEFYYRVVKHVFGRRAGVVYTDTDSLVLKLFSHNLPGEMEQMKAWMDCSNRDKQDPGFSDYYKGLTG